MLESFKAVNADFPWFYPAMAFMFGAIVGSFLNVCIYRIPAKKSIVSPGSTCACGQPIAWFDNIPILSWFILRGKARCCGSSYSFRYPFIEALTGALFLFAWLEHPPAKALCLMVFISMMLCASFIDLDHMEIPNRFSVGAAIVGAFLSIIIPALHDQLHPAHAVSATRAFGDAALGAMIGSGFILWVALLAETVLRKDAMGFGDVKLLGGIGAFTGWQGAIFGLFGGAAIGTIALMAIGLFKLLFKRQKTGEPLLGRRTPFGPMLASGGIAYALFLEKEVDAYFRLALEIFQ